MIAALKLLALLVRRAPRQAFGAAAMCAVGVTVAVLVGSTMVAAYVGLGQRQDRTAWREPIPSSSPSEATALQMRSLELFDGRRIDRVDLAATGDDPAGLAASPAPPGLTAVPEPGTAFVSPALAELIEANEPNVLGERFGQVVGTITDAGLAFPDELVAVVGRTSAELPWTRAALPTGASRPSGEPSSVVAIDGYLDSAGNSTDSLLELYRQMALVAVVLVALPALMLVGSAARLTAARRETRLAAIRLAGATPAAVRAMATAETAVAATIGALAGAIASLLVAPGLRGIELAGGPWFGSDLRLDLEQVLAITVGAGVVSVAAAVLSLRRVTSTPLGVARSIDVQRARWPRAIGMLIAFPALMTTATAAADGGSVIAMIVGLALVIGALGLVGPWVCSLMGHLTVLLARRPSTLLAGRRIVEDPRAAYRVIGSVVLAGLIAGFLAGVLPTVDSQAGSLHGGADDLAEVVWLPTGEGTTTVLGAAQVLGGRFGVDVRIDGEVTDPSGATMTLVAVTTGPDTSVDELRTSTTTFRAGYPMATATDDVFGDRTFVADVRRASLVILVAGLVLAAASSAVAAAAAVVDQRRTIGRLALAGVPVSMLQAARRWQSTVPLVAATTAAVAVGIGSAVMLMVGFGQEPDGIVPPQAAPLVGAIVGALAIGLLSATATKPLLTAAARSTPDAPR